MGPTAPSVPSSLAELRPEDGRWVRFTDGAPEATTFHHPAWLRVLSESYGYRALVLAELDSEGEVAAGLPLLRIKRPLRGATYTCLPFTDHCPPLARDETSLHRLGMGLERWMETDEVSGLEIRGPLPAS